jgi:hypothetical protein
MKETSLTTRQLLRTYACQAVLMQDEIARSLQLYANDMKCYNILNSYGSMSPGELARRSGITTGGVTKILDRLEAHGAIRRVTGKDRRGLTIELLSPPSSTKVSQPDINFDTYVQTLTERYTQEQMATICDFLAHGADVMRAATEELRQMRT